MTSSANDNQLNTAEELRIPVPWGFIAAKWLGPKNNRPIIGILTQPTEDAERKGNDQSSYLSAGYVKWVESSGGRVAPVPYDANEETLSYYFE